MNVTYLKGDATVPQGQGNKIIAHICNDIGGWGKGFVLAISNRWKSPEQSFRKWYKGELEEDFTLGKIQLVNVEENLWVANMIAQRDIYAKDGIPPIRYEALDESLTNLAKEAKELNASVHMPRIGCGLAGGKWDKVESIIEKTLLTESIEVYVYDFE